MALRKGSGLMTVRLRWIIVAVAVSALLAGTPAVAQWATNPGWILFAPANDVSFSISTERKSYSVREEITLKYRITNISGRALYAPRTWSVTCPAYPHVQAWFEDSSGRHTGSGYGGSCNPAVVLTLSERLSKEAALLKPGAYVEGTVPLNPTIGGGLAPGAYRIEAILYGWSNERLTEAEQAELPKLAAPLLRGEVPTSMRITLTR